MELLNFRFKNVKEKMDDISGNLDEIVNKKPTKSNNLTTTHNTTKINTGMKNESCYLDTVITFSRSDSINRIFNNELSKRSDIRNSILETDPIGYKSKLLRTENMNFASNISNLATRVETINETDFNQNNRIQSLPKTHNILLEEDKLIVDKWKKIHKLVNQ